MRRAAEEELEPLPKVAYDTISQKRLREILDEQGLATAGDKAAMVARHSRSVHCTVSVPCSSRRR